ncbi:hypothetical protein P2O21_24175, partial [Escherichia coli]
EWVHVQLHQQKGMISLSPPTICNSALAFVLLKTAHNASPGSIGKYFLFTLKDRICFPNY